MNLQYNINTHEGYFEMVKQYDDFYNSIGIRRHIEGAKFDHNIYDLKVSLGEGSMEQYFLSKDVFIIVYNYRLFETIKTDYEFTSDYFEIEYCIEGEMEIHTEKQNTFSQNELSISLNDTMKGSIIRKAGQHYIGVSIVGKREILNDYFGDSGVELWEETINNLETSKREQYYLGEETTLEIAIAFSQIKDCKLPFSMRNLYFESKVREILTMIISNEVILQEQLKTTELTSYEISQIKMVPQYLMDKRFDLPTTKDLSNHFGISDNKLKDGFKLLFNDTIFSYHRKNLLRYGADMLIRTEKSVNEIADELGYANASNFVAAFKTRYTMTPHKYREYSIYHQKSAE